jgi:hypothetical protein
MGEIKSPKNLNSKHNAYILEKILLYCKEVLGKPNMNRTANNLLPKVKNQLGNMASREITKEELEAIDNDKWNKLIENAISNNISSNLPTHGTSIYNGFKMVRN